MEADGETDEDGNGLIEEREVLAIVEVKVDSVLRGFGLVDSKVDSLTEGMEEKTANELESGLPVLGLVVGVEEV